MSPLLLLTSRDAYNIFGFTFHYENRRRVLNGSGTIILVWWCIRVLSDENPVGWRGTAMDNIMSKYDTTAPLYQDSFIDEVCFR